LNIKLASSVIISVKSCTNENSNDLKKTYDHDETPKNPYEKEIGEVKYYGDKNTNN
jgi:hypothetical protein